LIGLALLTPLAAEACSLDEVGETPAQLTGEGIVVDAAVNGTAMKFRLDTSSAITVLSRATAERLDLRLAPLRDPNAYMIVGANQMRRARVESLRIGSLAGGRMKLLVADSLGAGAETGGVLGEDVLSGYDVEIDIPHATVRFFKPSQCPDSQMPYWATNKYSQASLGVQSLYNEGVFTTARLNGKPVTAIVSTGAPATVVRASLAAALETRSSETGDSSAPAWTALFDTVTIGDETIHNARIGVVDGRGFDDLTAFDSQAGPAGTGASGMIIGSDFFRAHRALISRTRRAMVFTYAGEGVFQAREDRAAP
jgi:predicted aspartyl protease